MLHLPIIIIDSSSIFWLENKELTFLYQYGFIVKYLSSKNWRVTILWGCESLLIEIFVNVPSLSYAYFNFINKRELSYQLPLHSTYLNSFSNRECESFEKQILVPTFILTIIILRHCKQKKAEPIIENSILSNPIVTFFNFRLERLFK